MKAYQPTPEDLAWILTPPSRRGGTALEIQLTRQPPSRINLWSLASFADRLQSLPHQRSTRTLNLLLTSKGTRLQAWASTEQDCRAFTNQWQSFNPAIRAYPPREPWLRLRPDSFVRAFQLRMQATPFLPINYEYGRVSSHQIDSPVTHLHNSLPRVPPGTTVAVQFLWRQSSPYWSLLPWNKWRFSVRAIDEKAAEYKQKQTKSYYVAVRGLEVHTGKPSSDLADAIAESFGVFGRDRANGFLLEHRLLFPRARTFRLARAILHNEVRPALRGARRPRFMPLEAAALLHPPPQGQEPIDFPRAPVNWQEPPRDRQSPVGRRPP